MFNIYNFRFESSKLRQTTWIQTDWRFLTHSECSNNIHVIAVEVSGVTVVNKPPSSTWFSNTLKVFPHPIIYVGNFNSVISYGAMNTTLQIEIVY
jgi:hypothetical protein